MKKMCLPKSACVIVLMLYSVSFYSCKKSSQSSSDLFAPTLMTSQAIATSPTTVGVTAYVTKLSSPITAQGIRWGLQSAPNNFTDVPCSPIVPLEPFSCTITGLTPGTNYYFQSYATNAQGTGWGNTIYVQTPTQ